VESRRRGVRAAARLQTTMRAPAPCGTRTRRRSLPNDFREKTGREDAARARTRHRPGRGVSSLAPELAVAKVWRGTRTPTACSRRANPWARALRRRLTAREHHARNPAEMFY